MKGAAPPSVVKDENAPIGHLGPQGFELVHDTLFVGIDIGKIDVTLLFDIPSGQHVHRVCVVHVNEVRAFRFHPKFVLEVNELIVAFDGVQDTVFPKALQ